MAETHEWMFYETMWRHAARREFPIPWWCQQYFRGWRDAYDGGLFASKEAAFASNAHYRYWHMVGVKDHSLETLIGQSGEVEPVYDRYALTFFLFDPAQRRVDFPQFPEPSAARRPLTQQHERGYLPIIHTVFQSHVGMEVTEEVHATVLGARQRSVVLLRFKLRASDIATPAMMFGLAVTPAGPTGFQRHDKAGRYTSDTRIAYLHYDRDNRLVELNSTWGPIFRTAPAALGLYGNGSSYDPDHYVNHNPWADLIHTGSLNARDTATDPIAGLCTGAFLWSVPALTQAGVFELDAYLPVDDYRSDDLPSFSAADPNALAAANRGFWTNKLDAQGLQLSLPPVVSHLWDLFRVCRANLLMLSDHGEIHPGPTIYDSFWIRDSSVESIACALAGDTELATVQLGEHYPRVFHREHEAWGPVDLYGFFGGEHEKNDREWDSNGEALWAIGRLDRILGVAQAFGLKMYWPYVFRAACWIRDNRSAYGLLHSGWSAEHIGEANQPHYWDDLWGLAGLWEAAQLATRIGAAETAELWRAYDSLRDATVSSIRWVLREQRDRGHWETFVPTGPGDVGRLDSTIIGSIAYFHPCRLYMGQKLGADIDLAFRLTLDTIWSRFIDGGFRHDSAWYGYGPYLTLQLAHAFLFVGDLQRMDSLLAWSVGNAAYAKIARNPGSGDFWNVALGAWNEQHCYPVAKDFAEIPDRWWYMGDMAHGWACAELMLLLRDMLFFEAGEDTADPHIWLAAGVLPHWLANRNSVGIRDAGTVFGSKFGYTLTHDSAARTLALRITQPASGNVRYVLPCRFGAVSSAVSDAGETTIHDRDVWLPAGTTAATVQYMG